MPDQKPPRVVGDERETLLALLQYQRESVVRKVDGLTDDDARRQFLPSGTTLLWLVAHLGRAESLWIERRFAGIEADPVAPEAEADLTLAGAVEAYRGTWGRTDRVVADAPLDQMTRDTGTESPVSLRWILAHLLEETARHAGHADVLRELIDGSTGR